MAFYLPVRGLRSAFPWPRSPGRNRVGWSEGGSNSAPPTGRLLPGGRAGSSSHYPQRHLAGTHDHARACLLMEATSWSTQMALTAAQNSLAHRFLNRVSQVRFLPGAPAKCLVPARVRQAGAALRGMNLGRHEPPQIVQGWGRLARAMTVRGPRRRGHPGFLSFFSSPAPSHSPGASEAWKGGEAWRTSSPQSAGSAHG
jgi:hypothetical protein